MRVVMENRYTSNRMGANAPGMAPNANLAKRGRAAL
jgi:hypothetical protein